MKRLWVRLSAVAAVVASLGGGGYYFVNSGSAAVDAGSDEGVVAEGEDPAKRPAPIADTGEGTSPSFDAGIGSADAPGYRDSTVEPAQATWRDQQSQPIIRQVSGSESDNSYGDAEYRVGDAPPADPSAAYASQSAPPDDPSPAYSPAPNYGELPPGNDVNAPVYGVEDNSTAVAEVPNYSATDVATETNPSYDTGSSGYGPAAPVGAPTVPSPDPRQPVAAPSFANGESVGSNDDRLNGFSNASTYVDPSVNTPAPSPTPQFDNTPPPVATAPAAHTQATFTATPPPARPSYDPAPPAVPAGGLVAATPGARALDGRQTPSISMEKMAPAEIQVGKPAAFKTLVRNVGQVTAQNVTVTDRVPEGTQLVDATPQPIQAADGSLVWQFESLAAGDEVLISMEVMPLVEGEMGGQALVTFQAQASVRTICTKPQLLVEHSTEPKVLIGEDVVFHITISNPGSGDATGIVLEEDVPPGLSHFAGGELEYEVGTLRPNESRKLELVLKATEAGITNNKLRVRGDANLLAEHATQLEVIAPKLLIGLAGPRRRYLDRQVTYQVAFGNGGTAIAKNVELATYLPKGLKFVSTSGKGQYDARDHAVFWSLDQLAPGQEGSVELTALPVATGEQKLQIEGTADLGLSEKFEHTTLVEAITELVFSVSDTQDPIEVGTETTYEVQIVNNGSKTATNVQIMAVLPAELTPLSGEGTTRVTVQGQQAIMDPIERLGPRDEAVYKLKVKGLRAGDHIIDVRLVSDEVPTPVTKQESTKVYADGL